MTSTEQTECLIWMVEGTSSGQIVFARGVQRVVNNSARMTQWRHQEPSSSTLWLVPLQKRNGYGFATVGQELLGIQRLSIHTIRNGAVGGEKAVVHVHAFDEFL